MTKLWIDFETRSELDLEERGLDNYSRACDVLMMAYAFNDGKVNLWQPHLEPIPEKVSEAIKSGTTLYAWNAQFERTIARHSLQIEIPIPQFFDVMVQARNLALPGGLKRCGEILGLPEEQAKIKDGERLIQMFCYPCKMGGVVGLFGITWEKYKEKSKGLYHKIKQFRDWETDPEDWEKFCEYCKRDVESERILYKKMEPLLIADSELENWYLDQKINDAGLPINIKFVENALAMATKSKEELDRFQKERTGLENPNSRNQLLPWAKSQGYPYESLGKDFVISSLSEQNSMTVLCKQVLKTRLEASKTSYKKFQRMLDLLGPDGRLRYQYLFMGASRTGRWSSGGNKRKSGKGSVQVQNLAKPTKEVEAKYERAIELVTNNDYEGIKKEFSSVMDVIASVIRSAIQAPEGYKLVVSDLSAIENRVLGWLSECDAILKVFRDGLDPYVAFAVLMYGLSYEVLVKDKAKRQVAKAPVLGAGYGLGPGVKKTTNRDQSVRYEIIEKLDQYGNTVRTGLMGYAEKMNIKLTAEQAYVAWEIFRKSYPEVVQLWRSYEDAVIEVLDKGGRVETGRVTFSRKKSKEGLILRIELPSGRHLTYLNAKIVMVDKESSRGEKPEIHYDGIGHGVGMITKGWGPTKTYGGKFTENIDQAISRDILLHGMRLADQSGMQIVGHVHDEILTLVEDTPFGFSLDDLRYCMNEIPSWSKGLPLNSDGYEGLVYKKG